jgi:DNA-binding CsgD family transcriptional regulator
MELSPKTSRALDACYEAVITPSQWSAALDDLAYSLGARGCAITPYDHNDLEYGVVWSTDMWKIQDRWLRHRDWVKSWFEPRCNHFVPRGDQAVMKSHIFSEEELRKSRYRNEILAPAGMHEMACGIFATEGRYWHLAFLRGSEPFTTEVFAPMTEVARRMARIVSISKEFTRVTAENEIRTLERMGCAAVLLDRFGRVGAANQRAQRLFCSEFCIRHGRLWTASAANLARLDRFMASIATAVAGPLDVGAQPRLKSAVNAELPLPIVITRDSQPWLLIEAMPVASAAAEIFDGHQAILVISDMTHQSFEDEGVLSRAFGLTVAEARLAVALCEGRDLATVATSFGISPHTARSQLKAIFGKTGTCRQAELVARLAQIRSVRRH